MKKWYDEEYEFEIQVTGFLRGDHTEHYCRNGEEVGEIYLYLWMSCKCRRSRDLFKDNDDVISNYGSCSKWWRFTEHWR